MSTDDFSMAHHLIEISLDKIGQSRFGRGGISLHKNLLVATVLQKARFIFMEGYNLAHLRHLKSCCRPIHNDLNDIHIEITSESDNCSLNLSTDYNVANSSNNVTNPINTDDDSDSTDTELEALLSYSYNNNNNNSSTAYDYSDTSSENISDNTSAANNNSNNKNIILDSPSITSSPRTSPSMNSLTYLEMDKNRMKNNNTGIKRRRNELTPDLDESDEEQDIQTKSQGMEKNQVSVEEIVVEDSVAKIKSCTVSQSKRIKIYNQKNTVEIESKEEHNTENIINSLHNDDNENKSNCSSICSNVINNTLLSRNDNDNSSSICNLVDLSFDKCITTVNDNKICHNEDNNKVIVDEEVETPMEIDKITSLVSIFSFGNLSRTVSTPDFCSAQAKDAEINNNCLTQQRTFLTMTV